MARSAARSRGYVVATTFTVAPTVSGTAQAGQTLTAADGTIVGGTFSGRQWHRGATPIPAATGATYVQQSADIGHRLSIAVTALRPSGATVVKRSLPTAVVVA